MVQQSTYKTNGRSSIRSMFGKTNVRLVSLFVDIDDRVYDPALRLTATRSVASSSSREWSIRKIRLAVREYFFSSVINIDYW